MVNVTSRISALMWSMGLVLGCAAGEGEDQGGSGFATIGQGSGQGTASDELGEPPTSETGGDELGTGAGEAGDGDGDDERAPPGRDRDEDEGEGPANPYCEPVADWDPAWQAYELELVEQLNAARLEGGDCRSAGVWAPAPALAAEPALACAARAHAGDMAARDYFDHVSPEGEQPSDRLARAGYAGAIWAENIGAGFVTPAEVVTGWLDSDLHCANVFDPSFTEVGVGYAFGPDSTYAHYWTLMLGG